MNQFNEAVKLRYSIGTIRGEQVGTPAVRL